MQAYWLNSKNLSGSAYPVFRHFNKTLVAWAMRKYRRLKGHKIRASRFLEQLSEKKPYLFVHWQKGMAGAFA
jgi:RNA-directed DNA polymerase